MLDLSGACQIIYGWNKSSPVDQPHYSTLPPEVKRTHEEALAAALIHLHARGLIESKYLTQLEALGGHFFAPQD